MSFVRRVVMVISSSQPWLRSRVTTTISGPSGRARLASSAAPTRSEVKYWFSM